MNWWKSKLREWCAIDIRSLALFRIGLALIILGDLFVRAVDIKAHYTDWGVLPRDVLISKFIDVWNISIHFINGTWQVQLALFILAAIFAVALLVGYKTRAATILSWFLLISLHSRNPMIIQGGDIVLRMLLFWGIFLPLGGCWSIDQMLNKKQFPKQIVSMGALGLLLQVCIIYWFTAVLKSDDIWRKDGTAVWYALSIEQYSTPLGVAMLNYPQLLKILTFATLYLEAFGPFFAFSPIWTGPLRFATALAFIFFHLIGLNVAMILAHFIYVSVVAWIVFIPSWFWDRVLKVKKDQVSQTINWKAHKFSNGLALFFIAYIFLWNLRTLATPIPYLSTFFPNRLNVIGSLLRIDQYWNMFAPFPLKEDGWFVIPAKLRDGSEVDLFTDGKPVTWQRPPLLSATYKNDRWRSYMMNLPFDKDNEVHLLYYGKYLTKSWNASHPYEKQAMTFDIYYMLKVNDVDGPPPVPKKLHLWNHHCFEK